MPAVYLAFALHVLLLFHSVWNGNLDLACQRVTGDPIFAPCFAVYHCGLTCRTRSSVSGVQIILSRYPAINREIWTRVMASGRKGEDEMANMHLAEDQIRVLEENFSKVTKHPDKATLTLIAAECGLSEERTAVSIPPSQHLRFGFVKRVWNNVISIHMYSAV